MGEAVAKLSSAAASGQKVSATMYPYAAGGTRLAAVLPLWAQEGGNDAMLARLADPAQRARMRKEIEGTTEGWENLLMAATFDGMQIASVPAEYDQSVVGKRLSEMAAARKADPWDVLFEIIVGTKGRAGALYHMMSEADVRTGLAAPFVSIGTDSAAIRHEGPLAQGQPHPRAYGTFPRVLGHYVREEKLLTLRGRRASHDRPGRRAVPDPRSRRDARRGVRRPGGLRSGHRRRHRHLRTAAQLSARHRACDRQRHDRRWARRASPASCPDDRCTARGAPGRLVIQGRAARQSRLEAELKRRPASNRSRPC